MPFSRPWKAGLVAMVLIILTTVSKLDAAPMDLPNAWMQRFTQQAERESGSRPHLTGLDLNLPPPKEDEGTYDSAGQSYPAAYPQWTGNPEWAQHLTYDTPYGRAGIIDWQGAGQPTGYGDHVVGSSSSTSVRNGGSKAPTPAMSVQDQMRYAEYLHGRLAEPHLSDAEILEILRGDPWKGLDRKQKSELLNLFGARVFTVEKYESQARTPKDEKDRDDLAKQVVEEYLRVRVDKAAKQQNKGPLLFNWIGGVPQSSKFFPNSHRTLREAIVSGKVTTESAAHSFDGKDMLKPFLLGEFYIQGFGERLEKGSSNVWYNLKNGESRNVNVVALDSHGSHELYVGRAEVKLGE